MTITLSATDSNPFAYSSALGFVIISVPSNTGQLYQTSDGVTLGAQITSYPTLVTDTAFRVVYVNTEGSTWGEGGGAVLYQDYFQFQAQVTYNGTVVLAGQANTVTLSVTNSMVAYNGAGSWSYTSLNSSTMVAITLNGSNRLGGSTAYIVQQLPTYVSSPHTSAFVPRPSPTSSLTHCLCFAQGTLYSTSSVSSAITSAGASLSSPVVYYAPVPYLYSDLPYPTSIPVIDSFVFAAQDGTGLLSASAQYSLSLSLSTVPYAPCVSLASSYARQSFSNRTCDDSLLFLYTFEEGQLNSSAVQTADVSWQQLLGPLLLSGSLGACSSWNTGGAGIAFSSTCQTAVSSKSGLSSLIRVLSASRFSFSFTLELWVQPSSLSQCNSIAALGPGTVVDEGQEQFDVAMKQTAANIEGDVLGVGGGDLQLPTSTWSALSLQHVVLVLQQATSAAIYLNGQLSNTASWGGHNAYVSSWASTDHLVFANTRDTSSGETWQGVVSLVAMYSRALTSAEVWANYQAGLPNNLPVPSPLAQHVLVNASVLCSLTAASLQLNATDVDQQLSTQAPYSTWLLQPQTVTLYVTALPNNSTGGNLSIVFTSGAATVNLTAAMLPFALPLNNASYSLWFVSAALTGTQLLLPAYSVISAFAAFQVTANDGLAYGPPATVYIDLVVQPMVCNSTSSSYPSSNSTAVSFQFASPRVSSGLVALYTFTEGASNPSSLQSADQSGVNLLGNITLSCDPLSATWTSGRAGLHLNGTGGQTRAVSAFNVTQLVSKLVTSPAYSFEMWFTPTSNSTLGMIFGLGSWTPRQVDYTSCSSGHVVQYDIGVYQTVNAGITVSVVGGSFSSLQCDSLSISPSPYSAAYHLVITFNSTKVVNYLNSVNSSSSSFTPNASVWSTAMHLLFGQTASSSSSVSSWTGDIFLFSIYNRSLSWADVQQNYAAGLPHSIPVALPVVSWLAIAFSILSADLTILSSPLPTLTYSNFDSLAYANVSIYITRTVSNGILSSTSGGAQLVVPYKFSSGQKLWYRSNAGFHGVDQFIFVVRHTAPPHGHHHPVYVTHPVCVSVLVVGQLLRDHRTCSCREHPRCDSAYQHQRLHHGSGSELESVTHVSYH